MAEADYLVEPPRARGCQMACEGAAALVGGQAPSADTARMLSHLTGCRSCLAYFSDMVPLFLALGDLRLKEPLANSEVEALRLFERRKSRDTSKARHELRTASKKSVNRSEEKRAEILAELCEVLCTRAIKEMYAFPKQALGIVHAAVSLYEKSAVLNVDKDVGARCYQVLATVLTDVADTAGAQRALRKALDLFHQGTEPPMLKVKIFTTGFYIFQKRVSVTDLEQLLTEAEHLFHEMPAGEQSRALEMCIACLRLNSGDVDGAIGLLEQMKSSIDEATPAEEQFIIFLNLSLAYCEAGRVELAEALRGVLMERAREVGGDCLTAAHWLKGTLARVKGEWCEALATFEDLRRVFAKDADHVRFLECSLDICRVYAATAEWQRMRLIVTETVARLRERCDDPAIEEALVLLERSAEERALSDARIKVVSALLARAGSRGTLGQ